MMNLLAAPDPAANLNGALQGRPEEAGEGVALCDLKVGAALEIETAHHVYRIENRGDGKVVISGHPVYCPQPVETELLGSSCGGVLVRPGFIGLGMRLEFLHPEHRVVKTSTVRKIREADSGGPLM